MQHNSMLSPSEALDAYIGLDLGDRFTAICVLNRHGHVDGRFRCHTTRDSFEKHFAHWPRARIALEAGGQSARISQQLRCYGQEVTPVAALQRS